MDQGLDGSGVFLAPHWRPLEEVAVCYSRVLGAHVRGWREGVRQPVRLRKGTAQRARLFPHTPVCLSEVEPTRGCAHRGVCLRGSEKRRGGQWDNSQETKQGVHGTGPARL